MAFKLRPLHDVFGIHKDSEFGKPIILKDDLEKGIEGEANRDGTIFVNSKLSDCTDRPNRARPLYTAENGWHCMGATSCMPSNPNSPIASDRCRSWMHSSVFL